MTDDFWVTYLVLSAAFFFLVRVRKARVGAILSYLASWRVFLDSTPLIELLAAAPTESP